MPRNSFLSVWLLILIWIGSCLSISAQIVIPFTEPLTVKLVQDIPAVGLKGDPFTLTRVRSVQNSEQSLRYLDGTNGKGASVQIPLTELKKLRFDNPCSANQIWEIEALQSNLYENILKKGYQYKDRISIHEEAKLWIQRLEEENRIYEDPFVEEYLYSLLFKILPKQLKDLRPGQSQILLTREVTPQCYLLPDGTIILSVGLLSMLESEAELFAVLSHEMAHFVLDHPNITLQKNLSRKKREEFWAGFATALAAGAEAYLSIKHNTVVSPALSYPLAQLTAEKSLQIIDRFALKHDLNIELEADKMAALLCSYYGYPKESIGAYYARLQKYNDAIKNPYTTDDFGMIPEIRRRMVTAGWGHHLELPKDSDFLKKMASITSYVGYVEAFVFKRFELASYLAQRNVDIGMGLEPDYLTLGVATRRLKSTKDGLQESVRLLSRAKNLKVNPINQVHKELALSYVSLGDYPSAISELQFFVDNILTMAYTDGDPLHEELQWARGMIHRLRRG
jgi:beta-barrel assembly-enhancing protease